MNLAIESIDSSFCLGSGLDPAIFDTYFTVGVCAAGNACLQTMKGASIVASPHQCMTCGLHIHCALLCGEI